MAARDLRLLDAAECIPCVHSTLLCVFKLLATWLAGERQNPFPRSIDSASGLVYFTHKCSQPAQQRSSRQTLTEPNGSCNLRAREVKLVLYLAGAEKCDTLNSPLVPMRQIMRSVQTRKLLSNAERRAAST